MQRSAAPSVRLPVPQVRPQKPTKRRGRDHLFFAVEQLECRQLLTGGLVIAAGGKSATYTDAEGQVVSITVSAGTLNTQSFNFANGASSGQLQNLFLSQNGGFNGANVTATVMKSAAGADGLVNIGLINAFNVNLGSVIINGDLGKIEAGNNAPGTLGLKSLSVRSLGRFGVDTQASGGNLQSSVNGSMGSLTVTVDVNQASLSVGSGTVGAIASITIGGSLVGGAATGSGEIQSIGGIGPVKIGGEIIGGAGNGSASIQSGGAIASLSVGGSVIGGPGSDTGLVMADGNIGPVTVGASVIGGSGGTGSDSGVIESIGSMGVVKIGGGLIGGAGNASFSGAISANGTLAG